MKPLIALAIAVPLALTMTACAGTAQPTQPPVVAPQPPAPTVTPTPTATPDESTGAYRTGEAVGETAREVWETTKEFGRGLWTGFQSDNEGGE